MRAYQSPDVSQHQDQLKALLRVWIIEQSDNPDFNPGRVLHSAVVYVMQHLPEGCERVDGDTIQPLLMELCIEFGYHRPPPPPPGPVNQVVTEGERPPVQSSVLRRILGFFKT